MWLRLQQQQVDLQLSSYARSLGGVTKKQHGNGEE